ncbi:DUF3489 domain-containing protein [Dankookia sp. GCM10030260]|uniref:DUF3489 domain-containing protein n=1 Tax=Dankookia sp. GCM10030260 TaxID=3273390 RepID=UPI00361AD975
MRRRSSVARRWCLLRLRHRPARRPLSSLPRHPPRAPACAMPPTVPSPPGTTEAGGHAALPEAIAALRAILVKPTLAPRTAGARKPREGTKQQQVLALLRRPEGATVTQIAEATGWQAVPIRPRPRLVRAGVLATLTASDRG